MPEANEYTMTLGPRTAYVLSHPGTFAMRVIKGFRANQGLLLAGAVAYYALLSIVPLLILMAIALSHFIDQSALLEALGRYTDVKRKISPARPSRYSSTPEKPLSDQLRPTNSTLSSPSACRLPETSVTSSSPTPRQTM